MREAELKRLIVEEFLQGLADPRVERTRRHSLENILVISLLAVIAGADSFVAIEKFGRLKKDWLTSFLDLDDIPSHDTIGRVFAALEPGALGEAFSRWTLAIRATSKEKLIAIDGKTSTEDRYFICSRPNMTATEVLGAVRNHWSIENGLHWVLDVAFREATAECEQGTLPPTSVPSGSSLWDFSNNERR